MKNKYFAALLFALLSAMEIFAATDPKTQNTPNFGIRNLIISSDGRWSAFVKHYNGNRDTLLLMDIQKKDKPIYTLVKMNQTKSFFGKNRFLAAGNGKAELIHLSTLEKIAFENVREAGILSALDRFYILGKDRVLSVLDVDGKLCYSVPEIEFVRSDGKSKLYGLTRKSSKSVLIDCRQQAPVEIYSTDRKLFRTFFSVMAAGISKGAYLILTEIDTVKEELSATLFNVATDKITSFNLGSSNNFLGAEFSEIQKGKGLWIVIRKKGEKLATAPEIWYGNDGGLKSKGIGYTPISEYFLWSEREAVPIRVSNDRFTTFSPINSTDYVLAFDPQKNYKYDTHLPRPQLSLYNFRQKTHSLIFERSEQVIVSPSGDYMLSFNGQEKKWETFDQATGKQGIIENLGLSRPVFENGGQFIYFESANGIWQWDRKLERLKVLEPTKGKKSFIENVEMISRNSEHQVISSQVNSEIPILFKTIDGNNLSSYLSYSKGIFVDIISEVANRVSAFEYSMVGKKVITIEENFNMPHKAFAYDLADRRKDVLYSGNTTDQQAQQMKQDIIAFEIGDGTKLKGILYYPINYDTRKKYPMVVNIYQMISGTANIYKYETSGVGIDIRKLQENGYFVYLPDVLFGKKGTGLSALECVEASLDALKMHANIDHNRIGLTGYSMGGYETNFIATHSKRFATYISGGGHADIVRCYFSYSYHWDIPYPWQFENGQYDLNYTFAENKDLYFRNNPIHFVDQVNAPILIWTGKKDENVHWGQTMEFYIGLMRYNKPVIALFYPKGGHILDDPQEVRDVNVRTLQWWDYFLKDKKDVDWIDKQMKSNKY